MGAGTCVDQPAAGGDPRVRPGRLRPRRSQRPAPTINIVKVLGFFIDRMQGNDVGGWITTYPAEANAGMGGVPGNNFVVSVALVR